MLANMPGGCSIMQKRCSRHMGAHIFEAQDQTSNTHSACLCFSMAIFRSLPIVARLYTIAISAKTSGTIRSWSQSQSVFPRWKSLCLGLGVIEFMARIVGSCAVCVVPGSSSAEDARAQQIKVSLPIHLPFEAPISKSLQHGTARLWLLMCFSGILATVASLSKRALSSFRTLRLLERSVIA
jgi:hypothetical protein